MQGRFILGPRLGELAAAAGEDRLLGGGRRRSWPRLRDITGESAQLFRRQGDYRICVAAAERPIGLRDTIPVGSTLTMLAGSAAQILLAWEEPDRLHRGPARRRASPRPRCPAYAAAAGPRASASARPGVASVSAPVRGPVRPGRRRRLGLRPDRAALPPARAGCTRRRSSPGPTS